MTYIIHETSIQTPDGRFIPRTDDSQDYADFLIWAESHNISLDAPDGVLVRPSPPVTLDEHKADLLTRLADYRYLREIAGVTVGGADINTDRESQSKILQALYVLQAGMAPSVRWKAANTWVTLDAATMLAVATATASHVQGCFARESELTDAIAALESVEAAKAFDIAAEW